jgi:hypothetical protein
LYDGSNSRANDHNDKIGRDYMGNDKIDWNFKVVYRGCDMKEEIIQKYRELL